MNKREPKQTASFIITLLTLLLLTPPAFGETATNFLNEDMDINGDGTLNILVLGTNSSFNGGETFSPDLISNELQSILSADESLTINVNVVAEDIHLSKVVTVGLGGGGTSYNWLHHSHSLTQYYYWPEGLEESW